MVSKKTYYQMLSSAILAAASYLLVPFLLKKNSDKKYKGISEDVFEKKPDKNINHTGGASGTD